MAFDRDSTLKQGEKFLRQGRLDAAIREYARVVEAQPRDWNTANLLGDLHFRAGQVRQTIIEMDSAFLFVMAAGRGTCLAVLTGADANVGLIAYEMAMLVRRMGKYLAAGKKRTDLTAWLHDKVIPRFDARILRFDTRVAVEWGALQSALESRGRGVVVRELTDRASDLETHDRRMR